MTDEFEYLDHTADVIVHAWGNSREAVFENSVRAMMGYMTDLSLVEETESISVSAEFEAPTEEHMLFSVLDECLFTFMTEDYFIIKRLSFSRLDRSGFAAQAWGERMDLGRHSQGTEVKAVTMHGMSVVSEGGSVDVRFLLDI